MFSRWRGRWLVRQLRCASCRSVIDPQREVRYGGSRFCSAACADQHACDRA